MTIKRPLYGPTVHTYVSLRFSRRKPEGLGLGNPPSLDPHDIYIVAILQTFLASLSRGRDLDLVTFDLASTIVTKACNSFWDNDGL